MIRERESRGRGLVVVALAPVAIINNIYCILFNITILFNIVNNIVVLLVVALAPVAIYMIIGIRTLGLSAPVATFHNT